MIELCNVTKQYGDTVILESTSYTFPERGIVCLMGPSGGGKTTLLNLLAGFDTDYTGQIRVGGTSISSMNAGQLCCYRRDHIGFVFQNYNLLPGYTALENVCLAAQLSNCSEEEIQKEAVGLLMRLGLGEKRNQRVETLSGGQKQRVAIARALMGNPQILLADEPTGALDRATSSEIMELLREIAADRLVVVITHDAKICAFADEVIHIHDRKIVSEQPVSECSARITSLCAGEVSKPSMFSLARKNFKVHAKRYIAVSLAVSIGLLAFLFSLSFGNVMERSIQEFQEKNTAFNNGYIKGADDGMIFDSLNGDERVENVFYQYKLEQIHLTLGEKTEEMPEKYPMPKATESLSYGTMPRRGEGEIALSPSLAKKFDSNIQNLLGKSITLAFNGTEYQLSVSGIYNAGYDDFFVSSDVEQQFYMNRSDEENYSISYDVKDFSDIVAVSNGLQLRGISAKTAANEVAALQNTFRNLNRLFQVISVLILSVGIFLCAVLLFKLQNTRFHEVGLLAALGFSRRQISSLIRTENLLLSALATVVDLVLLAVSAVAGNAMDYPLQLGGMQLTLSMAASFALVMLLSNAASRKLLRTEPAEALRR